MPDRIIKRHDTSVQPRSKLLDEAGVALVLTGATITYTLRAVADGALKINRATGTLANQTSFPGEVFYQLTAGNVDTAGVYAEEWEIVHSGGTKETFPVGTLQLVRIEEDADNV